MTRIGLLLGIALSAGTTAARAEGFSTTNVQLLYGGGFHDPIYGNDTASGRMTTTTFEHFGTWDYGDNFFFVDVLQGEFGASRINYYGEWGSRLSLGKLTGHDGGYGPFKDIYAAAEIDRDSGVFYAGLGGVSVDLDLPGKLMGGVTLSYRYDKFARSTYQLTGFWTAPFELGPVGLVFTGFVDVAGVRDGDDKLTRLDIHTQPQLLVDVLPFPSGRGKLYVGGELGLHVNAGLAKTVVAPQAMVKWVF